MLLQKLNDVFFEENSHLVEVLDKTATGWDGHKTRGYGILVIELNNLRFGIPIRSKIHPNNRYRFITTGVKGLDYTKAVLLEQDSYISDNPFVIPEAEFLKIKENTDFIVQQFTKYVERYIRAINSKDRNILRDYRFSTLQNYHLELGIK